jgi:hypothetical protein
VEPDERAEAIQGELRLALHDLKVADRRMGHGDYGNRTWRSVMSAQMNIRKVLQLVDPDDSRAGDGGADNPEG